MESRYKLEEANSINEAIGKLPIATEYELFAKMKDSISKALTDCAATMLEEELVTPTIKVSKKK